MITIDGRPMLWIGVDGRVYGSSQHDHFDVDKTIQLVYHVNAIMEDINFDSDIDAFINNLEAEKKRVRETADFYPPVNGIDCIHCSALPWINFSSNKEANSGEPDSVPKLAFSKTTRNVEGNLIMNVSIAVHHALVDGYHIGLFSEAFQQNLNQQ